MFANGERNYAFAVTANKTLRIVHNKATKPKTSFGCSPSPGYFSGIRNISLRRIAPPPRWIAAVSAAFMVIT